ncbi:hypothetical protein [Bradyrhizobium sp. CCBAU 51753]|uniref:hypothetical protein n=1 Tax=Bradyrhizobium sp. CCBAU 51753 TaxID=1325100 RepID=UPI00188A45FF|nr:hypothetical protein [Bradyrhizobium sp. CCBAU 51753]QOZ27858.1 hypothetical protein XH93_32780 [Bradyrhizobium sp. CCBAU 51753]
MPRDSNYWFPAKRYGWGWGPPVRWQGWAVIAGFAILLAAGAAALLRHSPAGFIGYALLLTVLFTGICWWKGEPPRWRWGGD